MALNLPYVTFCVIVNLQVRKRVQFSNKKRTLCTRCPLDRRLRGHELPAATQQSRFCKQVSLEPQSLSRRGPVGARSRLSTGSPTARRPRHRVPIGWGSRRPPRTPRPLVAGKDPLRGQSRDQRRAAPKGPKVSFPRKIHCLRPAGFGFLTRQVRECPAGGYFNTPGRSVRIPADCTHLPGEPRQGTGLPPRTE